MLLEERKYWAFTFLFKLLHTHSPTIYYTENAASIDLDLKLEYIRKHAVRLLRLREQHTPPRSVIIIVISLQLMHFLIHAHGGKLAII